MFVGYDIPERQVRAVYEDENYTYYQATQLLETGNQIGVQQIEQMQKLRHLTASNLQMQAAYYARSSAIEDHERAKLEQYFQRPNTVIGNEQEF
ncbi:MAG: hypothetical protein AAGL90_04665 [Pseudomonadota bacterium]